MTDTVADFVLQRLHAWGVRRVYGYPGDGINGLIGAFDRASDAIDFVQVRHEEMAAFNACGHAKFTGELGVCVATSGPGAIHLLNGLYDAKLDHQPVLAVVGQQARAALGSSFQQEVDLLSLFKDVAGAYVQELVDPRQARHLVDRAIRTALSARTVTALIIPSDVQELDAVAAPAHEHGNAHSSVGFRRPRVVPETADLLEAAALLNAGERVAMLVGAGAIGAGAEVRAVAERLGAGVARALLGMTAVPDGLPYVTGAIGLLGTKPSWDLMQDCDTLLMVGTSFPYAEFLPEEGQARAVQIDLDAHNLGLRYPTEVNLVGDASATLGALLEHLEPKPAEAWRAGIRDGVTTWKRTLSDRAHQPADPVNPQLVLHELSARLPADAIVAWDSGSCTGWFARHLELGEGMLASGSGTLASMGCAVPYAIAAKFAHPGRPVIAIVGDGAMQMNGLAELLTIVRYRERWADQRLVVLVLDNGDLNQVTWEQRAMGGDPKFEGSQTLPAVPYARQAELFGLRGIRVDAPEQVGPAWDAALAADRPVVLQAVVDPDVPPLPPHISVEQAKALASAIVKGDPDARGVLRQSARQALAGLLRRD